MNKKILFALYTLFILLVPINIKQYFITYSKLIFTLSFIVFLTILITDYKYLLSILKKKNIKIILLSYCSFAFFVLLSIIFNSFIDNEWIWSNFFEFLRVIEYLLIFINYYYFFSFCKNNSKLFIVLLFIVLTIISLVGIMQYFNLFNLNEYYIKYIAPTQYITLVNNYPFPRIVGLVGNPNVLGYFYALNIVFLLYLMFTKKYKWHYILLFILLFILYNITLFMTLSRSSYICMIVGEFIITILLKFKFRVNKFINFSKYLLIIILFNVLLLLILPYNITWRFLELVNINNVDSWQNRLNNYENDMKYFNDSTLSSFEFIDDKSNSDNSNIDNTNAIIDNTSPIVNNTDDVKKIVVSNLIYKTVGYGPDKLAKKHSTIFDNEWIMLLFRYGYIGTLFYVCMLFAPLCCYKYLEKNRLFLYIVIMVMTIIYMIPSAVYHCDMLFAFTCILFAYALQYNEKGVLISYEK